MNNWFVNFFKRRVVKMTLKNPEIAQYGKFKDILKSQFFCKFNGLLTTIKLHWWFNEKMIREQIVIILCNHGLLSSIFLMRSNVPFDQIITVWFPNDLSHFNFFLVSVKFLYILAACNKKLLWHIDSGIINLLVSYYINEKKKKHNY